MPFLIDGHNLIPHMGLKLDSLDDEQQLIRLLQEYSRLGRSQVEVFFDNAQPGQPARQKFGVVTAHFVRRPQIADEAICRRIVKLAGAAKNWTVVSSDHRVQAEARTLKVRAIPSDEFARQVRLTLRKKPISSGNEPLSEKDIQEWLDLFENRQ
jgi:predicted RNA-binding protein with PIN domain